MSTPHKTVIANSALCRITHPFITCILLFAVGCKPAANPSADRSNPEDKRQGSNTSPQPTDAEFVAFMRSALGPAIRLGSLKTDPPVRMPNTSPASNVWLVNVKLTIVPVEDLLSLPPTEDAQAIDALVNELNGLINWRNAYARSTYAHAYGSFEIKAPVSPMPQLLVVKQAKDKPMAPIYGKVAAEWQVDHWQFTNVDLPMPPFGQPRAAFPGPTMVKGSSEAEAFLKAQRAAIASAKGRQAAIEASYQQDLLAATKPGTLYRGNVTHNGKVLLAELRFIDPPPGGGAQAASFALSVPNDPGYRVEYTAKLAPPLPLNLPAAPVNDNVIRFGNNSEPPVGNLTVNWSRCETKEPVPKTAPGFLVYWLKNTMRTDLPLVLLNHRIEGTVSQTINGDYVLSAEQQLTP